MSAKEIVKRLRDSLDYEFDLSFNDRKELLSYIERLEEENKKYKDLGFEHLCKRNEQLENNRDKAIEYVESHFIFNDKTGECYQTYTFDKDNVKKLYDILKGDSDD